MVCDYCSALCTLREISTISLLCTDALPRRHCNAQLFCHVSSLCVYVFVFAYKVPHTMHSSKPNIDVTEMGFDPDKKINDSVMEINLFDTPSTVKLVADNSFLA